MYKNSNTFIDYIGNLRNKNYNKDKDRYENLNFPSSQAKKSHFFTQEGNSVSSIANINGYNYSRLQPSQSQQIPQKYNYHYSSLIESNFNKQIDNRKKNEDYLSNLNLNQRSVVNKNELNSIIFSKIGLNNLGNTCYMNTGLQNLIHSKDFIERLLSKKSLIDSNITPITKQFLNLCQNISNSGTKSIKPEDFKYYFSKKHSEYRGYGEHDTQEFCRILLEDMNKELNEISKKGKYKELSTKNKSKRECDEEFDELFRSRESSIVIDSFYGQIINIFTCKCGYEDYSFQKVMDLPLLLPGGESSVKVEDLLYEYFKEDIIKFNTKCEECLRKRDHKKVIKFSQPPNILILSLQRIDLRTNRKNNCSVIFSEKLEIKEYIDEDCANRYNCKYKLYGISCYSWLVKEAHYYAFIKINDKDWYEFNDSKVTYYGEEINIKKIYSSVYALFYKKEKNY